ncbi:polyamine transporter 3 [Biscogniauxia marginata]|nr:polyamine transporter 3 [Biscogniauxia marginata]
MSEPVDRKHDRETTNSDTDILGDISMNGISAAYAPSGQDESTEGPDPDANIGIDTSKYELAVEETNPDVVDWNGPNDPENPKNWPEKKKWLNVSILSLLSIVTPLGSSMFAPGVPSIMAEFHSTSSVTATFLVSIYVLGFAFGPLIIAPLSEIYGRRPLYIFGNILFAIFTAATGLSTSIGMLLAFRLLMGITGSVPSTIGSGSIVDFMPIEQRGRAISAWALGPLLGPIIGPIAGGYLVQGAGWRWTYWLLLIVSGIFIPVSYFFLRETFAPVLLERKARILRKETGNSRLHSKMSGGASPKKQIQLAIVRPLKLLLVTPIVTLNALYTAVNYGILYLLISTFSFVYQGEYGFDEGSSGLTFIPSGIGLLIGVLGFGQITDRIVKRNKAREIAHRPEVRLIPVLTIPCGLALPIGLFIYGWTTDKGVFWIVPMVGVVIFSAGLMGINMSVQNYLIDTYPIYAASVTAALAVLRSLLGALLPLAGLEMYDTLGLGWGNSLLAFISLALVPIPVVFYVFGERIRSKFNPRL